MIRLYQRRVGVFAHRKEDKFARQCLRHRKRILKSRGVQYRTSKAFAFHKRSNSFVYFFGNCHCITSLNHINGEALHITIPHKMSNGKRGVGCGKVWQRLVATTLSLLNSVSSRFLLEAVRRKGNYL